jgi:predicted RNA methylase
MSSINQFNRLKEATQLLLNCGEEVGLMKEAVDQMYDVYLNFSSVNTSDQNDDEIILPSGKAISPAVAAQCLLDIKRTTKFIRGINKAIIHKLDEKLFPVQILYAGCGPYAALITPLLTLYNNQEISIDLLDVNEVSVLSAQKIIKGLKLNNNIGDFLLEDASLFKIKKEYDIVISETMQAGLRSEPQVAIMQNFFHQMNPNAIFIPEEIVVEAKLNTRGNWNAKRLRIENEKRIKIGEVLKVNRQTINEVLNKRTFDLCKPDNEFMELKLYTSIKIFENEFLKEGDSCLTSPVKLMELNKKMDNELVFVYRQSYPAQIEVVLNEILVEIE